MLGSPGLRAVTAINGLWISLVLLLFQVQIFAQLPIDTKAAQGKVKEVQGAVKDVEGKAKGALGKAKAAEGKLKGLEGKVKAAEGKLQVQNDSPAPAKETAKDGGDLNLPERSIHAIELEKYLAIRKPGMNTDEVWSRVTRVVYKPANYNQRRLPAHREVYGFHPFWMGDAWRSYNFDMVNRVGFYAYPVDPKSGDSRGDMNQWRTTALMNEAHLHGAKVDLVAALYGEAQTAEFLDNTVAQDRLISNLVDLLFARGDGVTLDFQDVPPSHKAKFSAFIIYLQERLKLSNPGY
ncbi:MAG: hypothetical protein U0176_26865, partial [Bacteroidia bacterium]